MNKDKIKKSLNNFLSNNFQLRLCSTMPQGRFLDEDIKKLGIQLETVFDVGANRGNWCLEFLKDHPKVKRIYCFEPVKSEYEYLSKATKNYDIVSCYQKALGNSEGTSEIYIGTHHTTSSLIKSFETQRKQIIDIITLDNFCSNSNNIESIDFLKIDTEGFELNVLKGATNLLTNQAIHLIQCEVTFCSKYKTLSLFDEIRAFLENYGYYLFGLYDQETKGEESIVYANACFIKTTKVF